MLVAFLVLILVGLATFSRVETQVAANNQNLPKARQNTLFALNVALGRLQETAGPDQRVTARADIDATAVETNRRWTGVWDSDPASASYGNASPGSFLATLPTRLRPCRNPARRMSPAQDWSGPAAPISPRPRQT